MATKQQRIERARTLKVGDWVSLPAPGWGREVGFIVAIAPMPGRRAGSWDTMWSTIAVPTGQTALKFRTRQLGELRKRAKPIGGSPLQPGRGNIRSGQC